MDSYLRSSLDQHQAHVWVIRMEQGIAPALAEQYKAILSPDELDKYHRFRFERDRGLYLAAHGNLRLLLSKYADVPPQAWEFECNAYGRPEISKAMGVSGLRFNISHCEGCVALLIHGPIDGGIDVERNDRVDNPMELAYGFFSPLEFAMLRQSGSDDERRAGFCKYWTLKEAFIKAKGMGLSIPLEQFSFVFDRDESIRISFSGGFSEPPLEWQFMFKPLTRNHMLAVALRRGNRPDCDIILRNIAI